MTRLTKALIASTFVLSSTLVAACERSLPTETHRDTRLLFDLGSAQPCQSVRGIIEAQVVPGGAVGTIAGDIVGSITTVLRPNPVGATDDNTAGRVVFLEGQQAIRVTDGTIPELIGRTLVWTVVSRSVDLTPIRRISNTLTVIEGATGHLVSHGILDLATLTTHFEYEGEICP